ncbi:ammonium transporter Rh type B-like [Macrobrachium rosenbergii]|uniref:ammonium transporter Rh type B-like n=1 Tax=Macrobrachium rosenbergii TaxID=79674 RepID=UPI0034D65BFF
MPVGCLKAANSPPPTRFKDECCTPGVHLKGLSVTSAPKQRPAIGFSPEQDRERKGLEPEVRNDCDISIPVEGLNRSRDDDHDGQPMWWLTRTSSSILLVQGVFVTLFTAFARYSPYADGSHVRNNHHAILGGYVQEINPIHQHFGSAMAIHMLVLVGIGLRVAFIRDFSYSAIGASLLIGGIGMQWAILCHGFISSTDDNIYIDIHSIIQGEVSSIAVSVSHGAVLGLASPLQVLGLTLLHIPIHILSDLLSSRVLKAVDMGGSVSFHLFSAVFGVAVSVVLRINAKESPSKLNVTKTSQLVAYLGSAYLVAFLPSVWASRLIGDDLHRATVNVVLATFSASVMAFPASSFVHSSRKFSISDIQCGLVSGFVAVGAVANVMIQPYGALLLGGFGSASCIFARHSIRTYLKSRFGVHDVGCAGVSHGVGGVIGGLAGAVMALEATENGLYGFSVYQLYPAMSPATGSDELVEVESYLNVKAGDGRSPLSQFSYQLLHLIVTICVAAAGGVVTGLLLRLPFLENLTQDDLFSDSRFWQCPGRAPTAHYNRHRVGRFSHGALIADFNGSSTPYRSLEPSSL